MDSLQSEHTAGHRLFLQCTLLTRAEPLLGAVE
jgi:hypothetical protein